MVNEIGTLRDSTREIITNVVSSTDFYPYVLLISISVILLVFIYFNRHTPFKHMATHYAHICDQNGIHLGRVKLNYKDLTFDFKGRTYNFIQDHPSYIIHNTLLSKNIIYLYNLNNPMPLYLKQTVIPLISSKDYNTIIRSNVLEKLNAYALQKGLLALITPKNILVLIVGIALLIYFGNGGSLT
jgi:hypothetical protein